MITDQINFLMFGSLSTPFDKKLNFTVALIVPPFQTLPNENSHYGSFNIIDLNLLLQLHVRFNSNHPIKSRIGITLTITNENDKHKKI